MCKNANAESSKSSSAHYAGMNGRSLGSVVQSTVGVEQLPNRSCSLGGPKPDAPKPLACGERIKERVCEVNGVLDDAEPSCCSCGGGGVKSALDNLQCCVHHTL